MNKECGKGVRKVWERWGEGMTVEGKVWGKFMGKIRDKLNKSE